MIRKIFEKKFSKTVRHSASLQSDYRSRERTLPDIREDVTDYRLPPAGCPIADRMDGVIVTAVHDEFRGMRLSGVREFLDEGGD